MSTKFYTESWVIGSYLVFFLFTLIFQVCFFPAMFFRKRKHMLTLQEYSFCNGWYREKMNVKTLNKIKNLYMEFSVINADTEEQENEKPGKLTAWLFPSYTDLTDPSSRTWHTRSNCSVSKQKYKRHHWSCTWVTGQEGDGTKVAMRRKGKYSHEPVKE